MVALLMEIIHTCLELRVSYNWRAMASKLPPSRLVVPFGHLFGFSRNNCVAVACIVRPHWTAEHVLQAVVSLLGTTVKK